MRKKMLAILMAAAMMLPMAAPVFATVDEAVQPIITEMSQPEAETPEVPQAPEQPGAETPEAPQAPEEPGAETPETPQAPEEPGAETPETPEEPGADVPESPAEAETLAALRENAAAREAAALADGSYQYVVYVGVEGYGTFACMSSSRFDTIIPKEDMIHRFFVDGEEKTAKVSADNNYALQNLMNEGYVYNITVAGGVVTAASEADGVEGTVSAVSASSITVDGSPVGLSSDTKCYAIDPKVGGAVVTSTSLSSLAGKTVKVYGDPAQVVYQAFVAEPYEAPVSGTPGLRTVKNYLATALEPVGTALYVYGGTWDWQDVASSPQGRTIGIPQTWIDFFQQQDANFSYRNDNDYTSTTYQFGLWNQYHYAGVDCSGYVGWSVYNVMNTRSNMPDTDYYVGGANTRAKRLAEAGFGEYTREFTAADFKPGDIMSMSGHCWICLGTCEDGSIVIAHSTPSDSKNGQGGGGIQISGVSDKPNSQAYQLAKYYMEKYYPEWSSRYDAVQRGMSYVTNISNSNNGKFSWTIGRAGLTDPDGFRDMSAEQVLAELFGEKADIPTAEPEKPLADGTYSNVVYVGVEGYGTFACMESSRFDTVIPKEDMIHRFFADGVTGTAKVSADNNYALQNLMNEGYVYNITVSDGVVVAASEANGVEGTVSNASASSITVNGRSIPMNGGTKLYHIDPKTGGAVVQPITLTSILGKTVKVYGNPAQVVYQTFVAEPYEAPVSGTPGQRTVKNYLATALEPVGTALYVYGGTWDWQDVASSPQGRTIGIPQTWIDFFQQQDANFSYRNDNDYTSTTYQFGLWNQYHYAGVDCSGYVGWSVYNVMNTQSGMADTDYYVGGANTRAKRLAEAGFGEYTREFTAADFKPGDIMSMSGHCWICLGTCPDGSIVIAHSTPSDSKNGKGGGGIQISGVSDTPNSQAYQLAKFYMEKYYPEWSSRYDAVQRGMSYVTNISNSNNGKFSWTIGQDGLTDPDGFRDMNAEQVLQALFGETESVLGVADGTYSNVVYAGIPGLGTFGAFTWDDDFTRWVDKPDMVHGFYMDGQLKTLQIATPGAVDEDGCKPASAYVLQNKLAEGYVYNITVAKGVVTAVEPASGVEGTVTSVSADSITVDGKTVALDSDTQFYAITSQAGGAQVKPISASELRGKTVKAYGNPAKVVYQAFVAKPYTPPVQGTPGQRTLKNFLATAMTPVGTGLYVYGGTWNWEDGDNTEGYGSSLQARTIGIPQTWIDFFQQQNTDFSYLGDDYTSSYYPHGGWNQYYYAGVDCSGYVGWTVYNIMNTKSFQPDQPYYVGYASNRGTALEKAGMGTTTKTFTAADFKPGDIFCMSGHVWICLGACPDGSLVILHSTPSDNRNGTGNGGGGIQLSGLSDKPNSQAYQLARQYMEKYYPQWSARYAAVQKSYTDYVDMGRSGTGKFSWKISSEGLTDPDGYLTKSAEEILKDLFKDATVPGGGSGGSSSGGSSSGGSSSSGSSRPGTSTKPGTPTTPTDPSGPSTSGAPTASDYVDVPAGAYYTNALNWALEKGITAGTGANTFGPDSRCSRAQIMTFLWRAAGSPTVSGGPTFSDVADDAYYAAAVQWAVAQGITSGTGADTFSPDGTCTRAQAVALIYKALGSPEVSGTNGFTDVDSNAYYANAVQWALSKGVTSGTSATTFSPDSQCTRAQIVTFLFKAFEG